MSNDNGQLHTTTEHSGTLYVTHLHKTTPTKKHSTEDWISVLGLNPSVANDLIPSTTEGLPLLE
jgi:hypothetical protein